jgi:hypothetical protein
VIFFFTELADNLGDHESRRAIFQIVEQTANFDQIKFRQ